jgi:hypothetical protein
MDVRRVELCLRSGSTFSMSESTGTSRSDVRSGPKLNRMK